MFLSCVNTWSMVNLVLHINNQNDNIIAITNLRYILNYVFKMVTTSSNHEYWNACSDFYVQSLRASQHNLNLFTFGKQPHPFYFNPTLFVRTPFILKFSEPHPFDDFRVSPGSRFVKHVVHTVSACSKFHFWWLIICKSCHKLFFSSFFHPFSSLVEALHVAICLLKSYNTTFETYQRLINTRSQYMPEERKHIHNKNIAYVIAFVWF